MARRPRSPKTPTPVVGTISGSSYLPPHVEKPKESGVIYGNIEISFLGYITSDSFFPLENWEQTKNAPT